MKSADDYARRAEDEVAEGHEDAFRAALVHAILAVAAAIKNRP